VQRLLLSFQCTHERLVLSALCEYRLQLGTCSVVNVVQIECFEVEFLF